MVNIDRISRFIELLKADKDDPQGVKFNMAIWSEKEGQGKYCYDEDEVGKVQVNCGTHACALGLAAISKTFEAEGLTYTINNGMLCPVFGELQEYDAAAAFFDLSRNDAVRLFDPFFYHPNNKTGAVAEQEVINRLIILLNGGNLDNYSECLI